MIPSGRNAVMASRREPPDSLDFFPTPPWATRALLRHVLPAIPDLMPIRSAWDPACGEGHMVEVLRESYPDALASDVFDYERGYAVADFLDPSTTAADGVDLIATNPPFRPALEFALRAIYMAPVVALLLRTQWLEGEERYHSLFATTPPTLVAQFAERVPMTRGRWDPEASTATAYAWFVWADGHDPLPVFWIPPGRRRWLTRSDDAARFGVRSPLPLLSIAE